MMTQGRIGDPSRAERLVQSAGDDFSMPYSGPMGILGLAGPDGCVGQVGLLVEGVGAVYVAIYWLAR